MSDSEDDKGSMPQFQGSKRSSRAILDGMGKYRILPSRIKPFGSGPIGRGGKGDVRLSKLVAPEDEEDPFAAEVEVNVAVKALRFTDSENKNRMLGPFVHEFKMMTEHSHPNIVDAIGFVEDIENGIAWVVLPWEANGNVREFLSSGNWEIPERISLIQDVADGLNYLHSRDPPICHGDLKSLNILVNSINRAVITDFGSARTMRPSKKNDLTRPNAETPLLDLATIKSSEALKIEITTSHTELTLSGPAWSLRWAAPEVLAGGDPDLPSDIWAFGWVCWEESNHEPAIVFKVIRGQLPSALDDDQASQIARLSYLMTACWVSDALKRPSSRYCREEIYSMPTVVPSSSKSTSGGKIRSIELLTTMASMEKRQGNEQEAASLYKQALAIARSTAEESTISNILLGLGDVYHGASKHDLAMEAYDEAHSISYRIGDQLGVGNASRKLGDVYASRFELSKAQELYVKSADIFAQLQTAAQPSQPDVLSALLGQGLLYMNQHRLSQAESCYSRARDMSVEQGNEDNRSNALRGLGDVFCRRQEFQSAAQHYREALDVSTRVGNHLGRLSALDGLGSVYIAWNEISQAATYFSEARDLASSLNASGPRVNAIARLGDCFTAQSDYGSAGPCFNEAMRFYTESDDHVGRGHTLCSIAVAHSYQSQYDEALTAYEEAWAIFTSIGYDLGAANAYFGLGDVYKRQSNIGQALKAFNEAAMMYATIGSHLNAAGTFQELGRLHAVQLERFYSENVDEEEEEQRTTEIAAEDAASHLAQAVIAYDKANKHCVAGGYHSLRTSALLGLGSMYERLKEHAEAEKCYSEARGVFAKLGEDVGEAATLLLLGQVHAARSQYAEAERYYAEALEFYARIGGDDEKAAALKGLATAYLHQSECEKAQAAFIEYGNLNVRLKREDEKATALIGLANAFAVQGQFDKAEAAFVRARRILSTLNSKRGVAVTIAGLAQIYAAQSKYFKAENFYIQAENLYIQFGDELGVANCRAGRGDICVKMSCFSTAEKLYTMARALYAKLGVEDEVRKTTAKMAHAEAVLKARREALPTGIFAWLLEREKESEEQAEKDTEEKDDSDSGEKDEDKLEEEE
ncbi:copper transport protein ctr1 [Tulasnella sp. 424]|nr:copper transport protein ctr1 [Tulasnella sp. 424]